MQRCKLSQGKRHTSGKLIAVNTDANHLKITKADKRILIGEKLIRGLGCGGYSEIGQKALRKTANEVINEVASANIIFLVAGLGGGTGAIIGLAEALRDKFSSSGLPHLVVGVVTLPFDVETARMSIAKKRLGQAKSSMRYGCSYR
ncbi:MAG: hypothetical protein ACPLIG_03265 [Candidatus Bathyarchaeales archaeon]